MSKRLTDAQLIAAYDAARVQATESETARKGLYADLMARTEAAGGVIQARTGVAVLGFQNSPKWDTSRLKSLIADGKLDAGVYDPNPRPRLTVTATRGPAGKGRTR